MHHFSDASQDAYGQVSYLRLVDKDGHIHCSLVMAKARLTPLKFVSIPRLEFTAAALSIKVSPLLKKKLTISTLIREFYWTDGKVVLGYIRNQAKRFKVLVANRVQLIRKNSDVNQWRYIETKKSEADYTSRGLTPSYLKKVKSWISSLQFLWEKESKWPNLEDRVHDIANEDREVKTTISINAVRIEGEVLSNVVERISRSKELLRVMSFVIKFVKRMKKISADGSKSNVLTVGDMRSEEVIMLQHYHIAEFKEAYKIPNEKGDHSKRLEENIGSLNLYLDDKGLIRVGGQLR